MGKFVYTGISSAGVRQGGEIEAPNRSAALAALRERGITPIVIEEQRESRDVNALFDAFQKVPLSETVIFSRQMATMVSAGLTVITALGIMADQTTHRQMRTILRQIVDDVEGGVALGDALERHPTAFDRRYVAMIRAGEQAGQLDQTMRQVADALEKDASIRKQIKGAMTYPVVVAGVSFFIVIGMLMFLVPQFQDFFSKGGVELPKLTQVLVQMSEVLIAKDGSLFPTIPIALIFGNLAIIGVGILLDRMKLDGRVGLLIAWAAGAGLAAVMILMRLQGTLPGSFVVLPLPGIATLMRLVIITLVPITLVFAFRWTISTTEGRRAWDRFRIRLPLGIGQIVRKVAVARFARTFATLSASGVPILQVFDIVGKTSGNTVIEEAVEAARARVLAGAGMAEPLAQAGVFPPMVTKMIAVGEESGEVDRMLESIADFYEEDVSQALKAISSVIEPIMVVVIGGVIAFVLIGLYLPIFTYLQVIQGGGA